MVNKINYKEIIHLHGLYLCGRSLSQVAKKYGNGLTRQRLYDKFKRLNLKTRPLIRTRKIIYNGNNYTKMNTGYWRKTISDRELLHRQTWKDENGTIPNNHDIHHIDDDKDNNNPHNLECLLKSDHTRNYCVFNNQYTRGKTLRVTVSEISFKKCKNCIKNIPKKKYGPTAYMKRMFCSKSCHYSYKNNKRKENESTVR